MLHLWLLPLRLKILLIPKLGLNRLVLVEVVCALDWDATIAKLALLLIELTLGSINILVRVGLSVMLHLMELIKFVTNTLNSAIVSLIESMTSTSTTVLRRE